ncbi:MAG TPA: DUF1003 domain-containing protein [Polyangiaceae bacterium]|jgi:uncharacterized membrane protein|nr:DUF1003 domain-containing protein [Polyangiaceae bacterium]
MVAGRSVRASLREELASRCGGALGPTDRICMRCIFDVRNKQIVARLSAERGALSALETEVARKAASHETIAQNLAAQFRGRATFGERMADGVARIGGSWAFVGGFAVALVLWMIVNSVILRGAPFDPYPYILLNLVLSTLAAIQAPVIMMSQNRASARDRMQADEDFRVNLKAEIEVAALHEKIDHLLHEQWESLLDMQQAQLELLEDLGERVPESKPPRDSA